MSQGDWTTVGAVLTGIVPTVVGIGWWFWASWKGDGK